MLAVHRKSKSTRDSVYPHNLTANSAYILGLLFCSEDPLNCFFSFVSTSNSFAICRSAIWSLLHPFLCEKRRVHHRWQQLVQLCKPMESQGLLCHWQAQSAHVSHISRHYNLVQSRIPVFGCAHWQVVLVFRGPVNEDVFATQPFHGGKIMDSDIQEISEQIHRLLLQVKTHTWSATQAFIDMFFRRCDEFIFLCSRSITWAPVAMAATVVTVPMNSRWASAHPARAMVMQEGQQKKQARSNPPGRSRRFVKGSTCLRTRIPKLVCHPHLLPTHHHYPSLSRRGPLTVRPFYC